jgi:hypothetical protein
MAGSVQSVGAQSVVVECVVAAKTNDEVGKTDG